MSKLNRPIVGVGDLAPRWHHASPDDKECVRKIADEQLVLAALIEMDEQEIWYDHGHLIWQMTQSAADAPRLAHRKTRETLRGVKGFYDRRTYHGRNGSQARKRDRSNGNAYRSTGFAGQVH